jgi:succinyl-CoA synthetase beta subunit
MAEKVMVASSQAVQSIGKVAVQRLSVLKAQIPVGGRKKAGGGEDLRSGPGGYAVKRY